jgi:hypothetical protein
MPNSNSHRLAFIALLVLLSFSTFQSFSNLEINWFYKSYGLALSLQGGFALLYFSYWRWRKSLS